MKFVQSTRIMLQNETVKRTAKTGNDTDRRLAAGNPNIARSNS